MKKLILIILLLFIQISVNAECRKDTIYKSTIEDNITYPKTRMINQFNTQNKIIESTEQNWNTSSKIYVNAFKETYTYQSNNKLFETLVQVWNSNSWKNYAKETNSYDNNGNVKEYNSQNWITNWVDRTRILYTYNTYNKRTSSITLSWNYYGNNTWDNRNKDSMIYDLNQNLKEEYLYFYDNSINDWEPSTLNKYIYNTQNKATSILEFDWYNNKWDSSYRKSNIFNSDDKISQILVERWDNTYGLYIANKIVYTYNSFKNITQKLTQQWDVNAKVWENYYNETYTYDANQNLISKSEFLSWDKTLNSFTLETKEDYKCSNILAIKSLNKSNLIIYPNPIHSNLLNISVETNANFKLTDLMGKVMISGILYVGKNTVNIEPILENGIYLIKINDLIYHKIIIDK